MSRQVRSDGVEQFAPKAGARHLAVEQHQREAGPRERHGSKVLEELHQWRRGRQSPEMADADAESIQERHIDVGLDSVCPLVESVFDFPGPGIWAARASDRIVAGVRTRFRASSLT